MAIEVQGFRFLERHPDPSKWTEADKAEFQLFKGKMLALRQQLDGARRQSNEQRERIWPKIMKKSPWMI